MQGPVVINGNEIYIEFAIAKMNKEWEAFAKLTTFRVSICGWGVVYHRSFGLMVNKRQTSSRAPTPMKRL